MHSLIRQGTGSVQVRPRDGQQRPAIARPSVTAVPRSGRRNSSQMIELRKDWLPAETLLHEVTLMDDLQDTVLARLRSKNSLSTGLNPWVTLGPLPLHAVHSACTSLRSCVAEALNTAAAHLSTPISELSGRSGGHPFLQHNIMSCDTLLTGFAIENHLVSALDIDGITSSAEAAIADMIADAAAQVSQQAQQAISSQAEAQQHSQQQTWAQQEARQQAQQHRQKRRRQAEAEADAQQHFQQTPQFERFHRQTEVFAAYRGQPGSKQQQFVHMPAQKQEYLCALQEGLEVVPLNEAVNLPAAMSDEQLHAQEQSCSSKGAAAGADANQQHNTNQGSTTGPCKEHIKVEVCAQLCTQPGEDVVLVGSHPALGSWRVDGAVPLTWTHGNFWRGSVELPAGVGAIQYKAVVKTSGWACWEAGANYTAQLDGCTSATLEHTFRSSF